MIAHRLELDYTLHPGWLTPFIEALSEGRALARRCSDCGKVSFPPVRVCPCGNSDGTWHHLTGAGQIIHRTTGSDGDFALVQMEGANTMAVMRLSDMAPSALSGQIITPPTAQPALCLGPIRREEAS